MKKGLVVNFSSVDSKVLSRLKPLKDKGVDDSSLIALFFLAPSSSVVCSVSQSNVYSRDPRLNGKHGSAVIQPPLCFQSALLKQSTLRNEELIPPQIFTRSQSRYTTAAVFTILRQP